MDNIYIYRRSAACSPSGRTRYLEHINPSIHPPSTIDPQILSTSYHTRTSVRYYDSPRDEHQWISRNQWVPWDMRNDAAHSIGLWFPHLLCIPCTQRTLPGRGLLAGAQRRVYAWIGAGRLGGRSTRILYNKWSSTQKKTLWKDGNLDLLCVWILWYSSAQKQKKQE